MKSSPSRWGIAFALLVMVVTAVALKDRFDAAALGDWVRGAGAAGPVVFVTAYAVATVLFLPGAVITLAGGALFGPLWGTLWNLTGATLGSALAFLIGRHLGTAWAERRAGPSFRGLNEGVSAEGWRFVAFVRLVPLFPFNLVNYALGLTRISFFAYVLSSAIFMLPGAVAYTWLGHAGREALAGGEGTIRNILIAIALVSSLAFLPRLVRRLRKPAMLPVEALKDQLDDCADIVVLDVRTPNDFVGELGHIAGARNLPLEELRTRLAEIDPDRPRPVRLVCRTDRRSTEAASILASAGFADARVVQGGMTAWRARGWPVTNA